MAKSKQKEFPSGTRIIAGLILFPLALILLLSLISYDWHDVTFLFRQLPDATSPQNWIGPIGAWSAYILFLLFGFGAYAIPLWIGVTGLLMVFKRGGFLVSSLWSTLAMIALVALMDLYGMVEVAAKLNITDDAGLLGWLITHSMLIRFLGPIGTGILLWTLCVICLAMTIGISNMVTALHYSAAAISLLFERMTGREPAITSDRTEALERERRRLEKQERKLKRQMQKKEIKEQIKQKAQSFRKPAKQDEPPQELPAVPTITPAAQPATTPPLQPEPKPKAKVKEKRRKKTKVVDKEPVSVTPLPAPVIDPDEAKFPDYTLPPSSLLVPIPTSHSNSPKMDMSSAGQLLVDTLNEFGIPTEISDIKQGPVVTRYELLPAPGIKVERIAGLANNLALVLKATSLRVQAPVPGKGVVGIEAPNDVAKAVLMREIIESPTWNAGNIRLPLALGKDVGGKDVVADLAKMPHLLIAGATGAGKSVCINSILTGLLMSKTPDELRLILVDPKIVEFAVYADLPHLVVPVITDPKKVSLSLRWAITEMEKRYKMFAKVKVRNIEAFNQRTIIKQTELFGDELQAKPDDGQPSSVPYIVIIIDELADLMMAAGAEIENSIARLAQLSRAVGIHMILATQRPSVNVITGTIKANFPARIAFQVAQKVDSRTILDQSGADKLLGRGDMLYLPPGSSKLVRSQGTMVTDDELNRVIEHVKEQAQPVFEMEIKNKLEKASSTSMDDGSDDELLEQAIEIIRETQRASTSSLQRRLRIGYTRAARIIDILEERGIVGPPNGSGPREILIDLDVDIPDTDEAFPEGEGEEEPQFEEEKIIEREV
jgi:S-DNA-T family DNA segregation ATPase FtsK/SpoIIIE